MPCPCIFCLESLIASFNCALKLFTAHGMFRRNVLTKIIGTEMFLIGHSCIFSILNSGASLLQVVHKLFQSVLSCAVCAQILLSSSGKPLRAVFACETKFRLRPVFSCVRPFAKPKRACRASIVGAIRATCPSHRVYLRPTKTLQSGPPNIAADCSLVMR